MVWALINANPNLYFKGLHETATIIGTKMFVCAAQVHPTNNCVSVFDTETNCWLSTPSAPLPERCDGHAAFAYNGELYIVGSSFNWSRNFSLFKFNPETFSWTKVEIEGRGPCSWTLNMRCCVVGDRNILFGGHPAPDLYVLDIRPSLKMLCKLAVIHHGLKQSELPHNVRWEL